MASLDAGLLTGFILAAPVIRVADPCGVVYQQGGFSQAGVIRRVIAGLSLAEILLWRPGACHNHTKTTQQSQATYSSSHLLALFPMASDQGPKPLIESLPVNVIYRETQDGESGGSLLTLLDYP
jgi:hypothetical protein